MSKKQEKIKETIKKIYDILHYANISNGDSIAILEGIKLDIYLNSGIITINGLVGPVEKSVKK